MAVQVRPKTGGPGYSPQRDIVYVCPALVKDIAKRLEKVQAFPELDAWLKSSNVTMSDLADATKAFIDFLNMSSDPDVELEGALKKSGWFNAKPQARVAFSFYLGAVMTGTIFAALREYAMFQDETTITVKQLVRAGKRAELIITAGKWRRRWHYLTRWFSRRLGLNKKDIW